MATAKRNKQNGITLKLSQDEADLIRSVFGDLYCTTPEQRARAIVSDIFYALEDDRMTSTRGYDLRLGDAGLREDRRKF